MIALPKPAFDVREVFLKCISKVEDRTLKRNTPPAQTYLKKQKMILLVNLKNAKYT